MRSSLSFSARPVAVLFLILFTLSLSFSLRAEHYDVVIRNGRVIDGAGNPAFYADLAIRNGRIAKIGALRNPTADKVIDAKGLMLAPGFIDVHTHADRGLLTLPEAENFVRMGVTTIVIGNCGMSPVDMGQYMNEVAAKKVAVNTAALIGHGSLRNAVMQRDNRSPTPDELAQMKKRVADAMEAGAVGLSTGLIYIPGTYARTDEIIELAKVVAQYHGVYASHIRNEGNEVEAAVREAIHIGEEARLPVEISHFKISSKKRWGDSRITLRLVEEARARGVDVTVDQYAYTASSTNLGVLLPSWALEGDEKKMAARLNDPAQRQRIKKEMVESLRKKGFKDFSYGYVASYTPDPSFNGKNLVEITKLKRGRARMEDQLEQVLEMQMAGGAGMVYHTMSENDIERIMRHPVTMIASDSGVHRAGSGVPHPRGYGNNARVLGEYVRARGIISLEDAIRKMTSLPAQTFRLKERGLLREGLWADLVVFDPQTVRDTAVFKEPHQYPQGITHVLVNGVPVVFDGAYTKIYPGQVLYGAGKK